MMGRINNKSNKTNTVKGRRGNGRVKSQNRVTRIPTTTQTIGGRSQSRNTLTATKKRVQTPSFRISDNNPLG
jgi:hypothetical protein